MLRPAYSEVMDSIDERGHISHDLRSRYIVVIAAAKRARQLVDGAEPLTTAKVTKDVSIAVKELFENKLEISPMTQEQILAMEGAIAAPVIPKRQEYNFDTEVDDIEE